MADSAKGNQEHPDSPGGWRGLADLLDRHRGERHIIVLQEYPDPDAISSALAHRLASASFDIRTDIVHGGRISHQENRALVKLLDVDLMRFHERFGADEYDGAVFVDNQGTTARDIVDELEAAGVPTLVVVDHHEGQDVLKPAFSDIRRIGSTAAIYGSYLEDGLVSLEADNQEHARVATALMHGILSDTSGFIRATPQDFSAAAYLVRFRDVGLLEQIMSQARSRQTMDVIHRALGDRRIAESYSIVGVGYLRSEDRDAIPQAADFLLTEETVQTSIVYGIVRDDSEGETLVGSLRTSKLTLDPDEFIKDVFGKDEEGQYFGGGKFSAGAFEIPIEFLAGDADESYEDMKWQVYEAQVRKKLFEKIGVPTEPGPDDVEE
jgi:nanoRNase/pAp phosphatase (c-di-AMP/oligoRNAs hydrolase)